MAKHCTDGKKRKKEKKEKEVLRSRLTLQHTVYRAQGLYVNLPVSVELDLGYHIAHTHHTTTHTHTLFLTKNQIKSFILNTGNIFKKKKKKKN